MLRLAQFAARFGFSVHEKTRELCRTIDLSALSRERIEGEMKKALLKSEKPSVFFEVLRDVKGLGFWFPELQKLIDLPQNPAFHPEGDVWVHTMEVLDRAVAFRDTVSEPFPFMMSALCHDLGKIEATKEIDGVIHAYAHESLGRPVIKKFLSRITGDKGVINYVLNMSFYHMKPGVMARAGSSQKSFNRLFDDSVCPSDLICLALSDEGERHENIDNILVMYNAATFAKDKATNGFLR